MSADLFKYFELALAINRKYHIHLIEYPARFRGSLYSISFISLKCYKPQIGFSCSDVALKNETLNIHEYLIKLDMHPLPQRPTPEKKLQSWLIKKAMQNGSFPFDKNIQFITDEFANTVEGKVVADIFGYNTSTNALVIIELKSSRLLKELSDQLNTTIEGIKSNSPFYVGLLKVHDIVWPAPYNIEKIAIWPYANESTPKKFARDIREFTYRESDCDYFIKEML